MSENPTGEATALNGLFSMTKRVFLVSGGRLVVYHWSRGRLRDSSVFTDDEAGIARFDAYLAAHPDTPSRLLVDVVEEEFREDRVPHVRANKRRGSVRINGDAKWTSSSSPVGRHNCHHLAFLDSNGTESRSSTLECP